MATPCAHAACTCEGTPGWDGCCCAYCAEAVRRGDESPRCECGHPPCGGRAGR